MTSDRQNPGRGSRMAAAQSAASALLNGSGGPSLHRAQKPGDDDMQKMTRLWDEAGALKGTDGYADLLGTPTWRERLVRWRGEAAGGLPAFPWRVALPALPVAAAAAIAIHVLTPQATRYEAGDQARQITLADTSSVKLGKASKIDFRISDGKCLATLVGEAEFSVAHDAGHPFLVKVGDAQVRVVGTHFTLNYRGSCTQLSVLSGTVVFQSASAPPRRLNAGEETVNVDNGQSYRVCLKASAQDQPLRWSYVDAPLSTVISDMQRFYPHKILIQAPTLAQRRVTTSFDIDEIGGIVTLLPEIVDAHLDHRKDGTILISPN